MGDCDRDLDLDDRGGGMTMYRNDMLAIGAVLFGVGLGAAWALFSSFSLIIGVAGAVAMAVGAGFIGFAVLRPTNSNDEKADG